ncbi:MAG: ClpXP protease specificity-enhancing factor, partial [Thiobacillus sp.]|nr:ClpXP protease specificity-enhancing factor [Thiobacillus sp.]
NACLSFSARFGGVAQVIEVPVASVVAIYAKETGDGMAFNQAVDQEPKTSLAPVTDGGTDTPPPASSPERPKGKPSLRVVK